MRKTSKFSFVAALTAVFAMALSGLALAATNLGDGDVAIVDTASAAFTSSNRAQLVRAGSAADATITVTADDGNINSTHCGSASDKNKVWTKRDWVLGASGLAAIADDGTTGYTNPTVEAAFTCDKNFSHAGNAETKTLAVKVFAATDAALGASAPTVTFGTASSSALVKVGSQVTLRTTTGDGETAFVNPTLPVAVNPRPPANLTATAGNAEITLVWTKSLDQTTGIDYQIQRKTGTNAFADIGSPHQAGAQVTGGGNENKLSFTDTSLTNGTEYCYQIRARFTQGTAPNLAHFYSTWIPTGTDTVCSTPVAASTLTHSAFSAPLDLDPVINKAKAGRAFPMKWRTTDADGNGVAGLTDFAIQVATSNDCTVPGVTGDSLETYSTAAGGLVDHGNGYYQIDWKSPSDWANKCRRLTLTSGGTATTTTALLQFTK